MKNALPHFVIFFLCWSSVLGSTVKPKAPVDIQIITNSKTEILFQVENNLTHPITYLYFTDPRSDAVLHGISVKRQYRGKIIWPQLMSLDADGNGINAGPNELRYIQPGKSQKFSVPPVYLDQIREFKTPYEIKILFYCVPKFVEKDEGRTGRYYITKPFVPKIK